MPRNGMATSSRHSVPLPDAEDPRWQLVERILATPDFKRAQKSSEFLRVICQLTLQERQDLISEEYLGETIFGRPPNYNFSADTIVRSHALRLRQRLEQYFQREGQTEGLRLVIPRGGYVPQFVPAPPLSTELEKKAPDRVERQSHSAEELQPVQQAPSTPLTGIVPVSRLRVYEVLFGAALATAVLLAAALVSAHRSTPSEANTSRVHPLWSEIFTPTKSTIIVMGDAGLALFHELTHQPVNENEYSNPSSISISHSPGVDPERARALLRKRYTFYWNVSAIANLARLPGVVPSLLRIRATADMRAEDFKNTNVILLGKPGGKSVGRTIPKFDGFHLHHWQIWPSRRRS